MCQKHCPEALGIGLGSLILWEKEKNARTMGPKAWLVKEARSREDKGRQLMGECSLGAQHSLYRLSSACCFDEGITQGTFQQLFKTFVLMSWNDSGYVGGGSPLSHFSFLLSLS